MARNPRVVESDGIYETPFPQPQYQQLYMVSDDGVPLVEIRIHERAQEGTEVAELRAWHERIRAKEALERRGGLTLITPGDGDVA